MLRVGVLGATGAVGQRFVQLLAQHPWFELAALTASDRSAGKRYGEVVNWRLDVPFPREVADIPIRTTATESLSDVDLVFSALPAEVAGPVESACADAGIAVCSNASSHRMDPLVPLVIPEVNPDHLSLIDAQRDAGRDGFIVTNPNCSTIVMCLSLAPLRQFEWTDVRVATMQAISGAGFQGVPAMSICDNIIPYIGSEEQKMETEPLKIMGSLEGKSIRPATFRVSASCHRVPVLDGHTMAIWIDIKESAETVRKAFADFSPPVNGLPSLPEKSILLHDEQDRPQPRLDRNRGGGMTASVGRVRDGIRYVVMGHNTIRGAAGASVLNAELIHKKKYL